jgi:glycosyltransferase involved in cell wall biosynthesis
MRRRKILKSMWWRVFERRALDEASAGRVFFEEKRSNLDRLGYEGRVIVAPNSVTPPPFETPAERRKYALWIGRFDVEHKGIDLLLQTHAWIPHESGHSSGSTVQSGEVERRRQPPQFEIRPWRSRSPSVLRYTASTSGSCFLSAHSRSSSRWDFSSLVVLEAAGVGAPTVVTTKAVVAQELAEDWSGHPRVSERPWSMPVDLAPTIIAAGRRSGERAAQLVGERFGWSSDSRRLLDQLTAQS